MTPNQFREIALSMPEAVEGTHMRHRDFLVEKKVFATLGYPDQESGMVKLTPAQQRTVIEEKPGVSFLAKGAWGKRGSAIVNLKALDKQSAARAIQMAWKNIAAPV